MRVGLVWLLINWTLDAVVLIPLSGMDFATYAAEIGIGYLVIPVVGFAFDQSRRKDMALQALHLDKVDGGLEVEAFTSSA